MISVNIVGRVSDRPFRPGNAQRVVLKLAADDERGRTQHLELDAFGDIGDWVMKNVSVGESLAVQARLEQRTYRERGEEVDELRIVAIRFEPTARRSVGQGDRLHGDRAGHDRFARPVPGAASLSDDDDDDDFDDVDDVDDGVDEHNRA